jgi:hypothetical protein
MRGRGLVLIPVLLSACSLSAQSFSGAILEMTVAGVSPSPPNQHFELWARDSYDDTVRVSGIYELEANGALSAEQLASCRPLDSDKQLMQTGSRTIHCRPFGLTIRQAIRMDDPCLVKMPASANLYPFTYDPSKLDPTEGNLLVTAGAFKQESVAGVSQSPEEQAQSVRARISQVTSTSICDGTMPPGTIDPLFRKYHCGVQPATMLAIVPADSNLPPVTCETNPNAQKCTDNGNAPGCCIPWGAGAIDRLNACMAYWNKSVLTYTANPYQLVSPQHGTVYGFVSYITVSPPADYDGLRIDSDINLNGIQELWYTTETDTVDPNNRGPILLRGVPDTGGRGWVHFDLTPPFGAMGSASGTASIYVDPSSDQTQF